MSDLFETEVVEENIDVSKAIVVTQKPIIVFELLEPISKNVTAKIQSLNIESLEPTEDNLALIKRTRTDLKKDFDSLEDARKMAKELIMADYNRLDEMYKKLISSPFKVADDQLKNLVDTVESGILKLKIDGLKEYFEAQNTFDFVSFDDMGLKIIKSKSDKGIKAEIDEYLAGIKMSLATIETLPNKERVLAKFQMSKDLNRSISETNIEIQREEQIKAQNAERERLDAERKQRTEEQRIQAEQQRQEAEDAIVEEVLQANPQLEKQEPQPMPEDQVYKASFTVYATKSQLSELKTFMKEKGIRYE
jgi:hypothetical protein